MEYNPDKDSLWNELINNPNVKFVSSKEASDFMEANKHLSPEMQRFIYGFSITEIHEPQHVAFLGHPLNHK